MVRHKNFIFYFLTVLPTLFYGQDVELYQQFNGHYDYIAFGNTLNLEENGGTNDCNVLLESSANLQLQGSQELIAAYLYWAGSGNGDFDIKLNGISIVAERSFSESLNSNSYFAAFADITSLVGSSGNGVYTLSDLMPDLGPTYCDPPLGNNTNFAGWAVTIIYEDGSLPLNQVNVFDGLESVSSTNTSLTIVLDNLNVLDNTGAKIGFLAWEGDASLAVNETLQINGNNISNPPLNPANNQFNSTNSFTNSDELYNMDIDVYNIENYIQPGDTTASIDLTSGQDFVMINNVITVLNTELPDASIEIETVVGGTECGNRNFEIEYTVYNLNSTSELPANTPIAFYANEILIGQSATMDIIPIDGSENGTIPVVIPMEIPADFQLKAVVDDDGTGNGTIQEIDETNNEFIIDIHLLIIPDASGIISLELCDVIGTEYFDLTMATSQVNPIYSITYHELEEDAINNQNPIENPEAYENITNPQVIYVRVSNTECFVIDHFNIEVIDCPLPDATITLDNDLYACRLRELIVKYTVHNTYATGPIPENTPISFYIENEFVAQSFTQSEIPIGGNETGEIAITLPENIPDNFILKAVVDDDGDGNGIVEELDELNNEFQIEVEFGSITAIGIVPNIVKCDEGFNKAIFDLTVQNEIISIDPNETIKYFTTFENAMAYESPISDPEAYENGIDPQIIYVRLDNQICFSIGEFLIATENCAPWVPQGFSPNGDGINDVFEISGLLNIFENFELVIYSRKGNQIHRGFNKDGFWDGIATEGFLFKGSLVPVGTYYYALELNDERFPKALLGYVYINY